MKIKATASGGGVYIVTANGVEVSRHSSLHKAMEAATNAEIANPAYVVEITQSLRIKVEAEEPVAEPPSPLPSFVKGSWGSSWAASWGNESVG